MKTKKKCARCGTDEKDKAFHELDTIGSGEVICDDCSDRQCDCDGCCADCGDFNCDKK
jgi:hypothetical protein